MSTMLVVGDNVMVKKYGGHYLGKVTWVGRTRVRVRFTIGTGRRKKEREDTLRVVWTKEEFTRSSYKCCIWKGAYF